MPSSRLKAGIKLGSDGRPRCFWGAEPSDYEHYHDSEWGFPVRDDHRLFEKICLEGFQAGLSWLTILRKRENFRRAFAGFDYEKVARFDQRRIKQLLADPGIVRHRGKIEATVHNARRAIVLVEQHGSLSEYFWRFVPEAKERPKRLTHAALLAMPKTATSSRLSKDLKQHGFAFVGPTTCYAFMQAMGLVNDHLEGCVIRPLAERLRA